MQDQANGLRHLIRETGGGSEEPPGHRARTLVVTSGKGGVGKSNLSLNLAISLAQRGRRVVLLDADFGPANVDVLCQIQGPYNLSHLLTGARKLSEVLVPGPAGVRIIPGARGVRDLADAARGAPASLLEELDGLEEETDDLVVDTGSGLHRTVREFIVVADLPLLVTTPEPTAVTDAYAVIKSLAAQEPPLCWHLVVNQASSPGEAHEVLDRIGAACRRFLGITVPAAGYVLADPHVPAAVRRRRPVILEYPACPASRSIGRLAEWLTSESCPVHTSTRNRVEPMPRFFTRMADHLRRVAAL